MRQHEGHVMIDKMYRKKTQKSMKKIECTGLMHTGIMMHVIQFVDVLNETKMKTTSNRKKQQLKMTVEKKQYESCAEKTVLKAQNHSFRSIHKMNFTVYEVSVEYSLVNVVWFACLRWKWLLI